MAVNVLGEEVEEVEKTSPVATKSEPIYSPYDDLAFVMYVDTEIADLVRDLDERKRKAVSGTILVFGIINCLEHVDNRSF